MVDIFYKKNKNNQLFESLEKSDVNVENLQNYIPIYKRFFSLSETNFQNVNLEQKYYLKDFKQFINKNIISCSVSSYTHDTKDKVVSSFLKFSPLLDPLKYLCGKYDLSNTLVLPSFIQNSSHPKMNDENNSAYVDSFFNYLSSICLHEYNFTNGLDFYGSYLGIKNNFSYDIADDIDFLNDSEFFHHNKDCLFTLENSFDEEIFQVNSRKGKNKLNISLRNETDISLNPIEESIDIPQNDISNENLHLLCDLRDLSNIEMIFETQLLHKNKSECSSSSSYSSKSCNTTLSDYGEALTLDISLNRCRGESLSIQSIESQECDSDENKGNEDDDSSLCTSSIDEEDEIMNISIKKFPVQVIAMEKCENTLDFLMVNDMLSSEEWKSAFFQIIISLIVFQKCFDFTHNDLHTNNVMYVSTEKKFLYYCFDKVYYKVPTFGRIYKIIDFGRSIYRVKNKLICSDSFHPKGDASTQYNFEPYYDSNKPIILPNKSFDLCRLACSIFDYFIEDISEMKEMCEADEIIQLICEWLTDDNGKNILYKTNGEERYPEFKLYKMIVRLVHNHEPQNEIKKVLFKSYITSKNKINKKQNVINIDKMEKQYN